VKTLAKEHSLGLFTQTSPGNWELAAANSTGYWELVGTSIFVSSTYFDLAGMSMEEKTLFFEAAGTQAALPPAGTTAAVAGDALVIGDLMTSSPLTPLEAAQAAAFGNFPPAPLSFQETVYGRIDSWVVHIDTGTWGSYTLTNSEQIGSMMPTASDRVYSYRVVSLAAVPPTETAITISAARHILKAVAKEEPDHEYMMRLLRSYQLQQEPDVD
jgi:hypothetical protein